MWRPRLSRLCSSALQFSHEHRNLRNTVPPMSEGLAGLPVPGRVEWWAAEEREAAPLVLLLSTVRRRFAEGVASKSIMEPVSDRESLMVAIERFVELPAKCQGRRVALSGV